MEAPVGPIPGSMREGTDGGKDTAEGLLCRV